MDYPNIQYLGHDFAYIYGEQATDYRCNHCNVVVLQTINTKNIYEIIGYEEDGSPGGVPGSADVYDLTCSEQIIKNLLE